MNHVLLKILTILFFLLQVINKVHAHGDDHPDVEIHTFQNGETWKNCSFQLHSSLTQSEFKRFTREAGSAIYFQPLSGASSLGRLNFNISLAMSSSPIDQTSGAWNNTFAHPVTDLSKEDPHWLGDKVNLPNIRFRMGLTDNLEIGTYFTKDPEGNYGFWGGDLKLTHELSDSKKLQSAARVSYSRLFGPADLKLDLSSIDGLVSKTWSVVEVYSGLSASLSRAKETAEAVDLSTEYVLAPRVLLGTKLDYRWASASVEYDISALNTFSFKIGATF